MFVILGVLVLTCVITSHELGHTFIMKKHGVVIREICFLGFGPKLFTLHLRYLFGDVPVTMRLIPVGASVKEKRGELKKLDNYTLAHIYAGGIAVNLMTAGVCAGGWLIYLNGISRPLVLLDSIGTGCAIFLAGYLLWVSPRCAMRLTFLFGVGVIAWVTHLLVADPAGINGPIAVWKQTGDVTSFADALMLGLSMSVGVGVMNMLPFAPLDGGHILLALLRERRSGLDKHQEKRITKVMVLIVFALIGAAIVGDLVHYGDEVLVIVLSLIGTTFFGDILHYVHHWRQTEVIEHD